MNRLVIGTRRYSSWSLRGWLAVRLAGLNVHDEVIPLKGGGQTVNIHAISPNRLVPFLEHDGAQIWESIAICEYCAEFLPSLLPQDRLARACARSISAEMHCGFRALRQALPMNLGRIGRPLQEMPSDVLREIEILDRLWVKTIERFGGSGPYLFGSDFTIADIMFAPVISRFHSYGIALSVEAQRYADAVRAHPLMREWYRLAELEPLEWRLSLYEAVP